MHQNINQNVQYIFRRTNISCIINDKKNKTKVSLEILTVQRFNQIIQFNIIINFN